MRLDRGASRDARAVADPAASLSEAEADARLAAPQALYRRVIAPWRAGIHSLAGPGPIGCPGFPWLV